MKPGQCHREMGRGRKAKRRRSQKHPLSCNIKHKLVTYQKKKKHKLVLENIQSDIPTLTIPIQDQSTDDNPRKEHIKQLPETEKTQCR